MPTVRPYISFTRDTDEKWKDIEPTGISGQTVPYDWMIHYYPFYDKERIKEGTPVIIFTPGERGTKMEIFQNHVSEFKGCTRKRAIVIRKDQQLKEKILLKVACFFSSVLGQKF